MGDDREIADVGDGSRGHAAQITPASVCGKVKAVIPGRRISGEPGIHIR
jgi:hypothetical protein